MIEKNKVEKENEKKHPVFFDWGTVSYAIVLYICMPASALLIGCGLWSIVYFEDAAWLSMPVLQPTVIGTIAFLGVGAFLAYASLKAYIWGITSGVPRE